jgi:hypothetical protein
MGGESVLVGGEEGLVAGEESVIEAVVLVRRDEPAVAAGELRRLRVAQMFSELSMSYLLHGVLVVSSSAKATGLFRKGLTVVTAFRTVNCRGVLLSGDVKLNWRVFEAGSRARRVTVA